MSTTELWTSKAYSRFYYYLYSLLALGIVTAAVSLAAPALLTQAVTLYIILVLVGGALYFSICTARDDKKRKKWIQENLN